MRKLLISCIFVVFCFFTVVILAQVPQLLNYQGRLTDDAGTPIITPTTVRFSLYQGGDAATPGSGTLCYKEDGSVTPDGNGVFNYLIGSGTVIFGSLDSTVFQTADPVYLEITIDPAGANETLLPRKQIVTVGYSFKSELADDADTVDGQDASAFAPVVHNHDPDYVNEGQADSVNSAMIVDGTIVDADINASANIAASKIDPTGLDADLLDGKDSLDFVHTAGDDMTGTLDVNTSSTYALIGESSNTSGRGVHGYASATSGTNYGVYGRSDSDNGTGVYGWASATSGGNLGVHGKTDGEIGRGVLGEASATSGANVGVWGVSSSTEGTGVYGNGFAISGTNYGVYGTTRSPSGYGVYGTAPFRGVYGEASSTTGTNYGVFGKSGSDSGYGVYGTAPFRGVYGEASSTTGTSYGVYGSCESTNGYGVFGHASSTGATAVFGYATADEGMNYGVYGRSDSHSGIGVYGIATAFSGTNYGIYVTTNSPSGYAGYFKGKTHVQGTFTATTKSCVQPIDNGKKVLLYAMESPEIWFEDFGTAQLVNGQAVVQLESVFTQAANTEIAYFVFPIPNGDCNGLYISRQDKDSLEVRELGGGTSSISFYYRIVAKRRGYEEVRFEEFNEPEQPPAEQNLPIEKK